jgi:hypothetical protein
MNAGFLPLALLCAALGLALAKTPWKIAAIALAALVASALLSTAVIPTAGWETPALLGLWISAGLTAALAYLPRGIGGVFSVLAGGNAGLWVGVVAHSAGGGAGIASALPLALLFLPAAWLLQKELGAAVKIAASWIVAVSILAGMVAVSPTPGYAPDHMQ